jgi:cobalt-zinc-cadmium efflux system protein
MCGVVYTLGEQEIVLPRAPAREQRSTAHFDKRKKMSEAGTRAEHKGHGSRALSRKVLFIALAISGTFFAIELSGGILTNSLALISDAGHLLTDVGSLGLALFAFWFATRPASAQRSYGYYRAEILAAMVNGLALWGISVYIFYEAYQRFLSPPQVHSLPMLIIASVGLLANVVALLVLKRAAGENLNVKAAYIHVITDVWQSMGVIIAGLVMVFFRFYLADPIISVLIGAFIIYSGGRIVAEAVHILLEGTPKGLDLRQVERALAKIDGVCGIHDIHAWVLTSGYNAMSAHVVYEKGLDAGDIDLIRHRLREAVMAEFPIHHLTIQLEDSDGECCETCCLSWLEDREGRNDDANVPSSPQRRGTP